MVQLFYDQNQTLQPAAPKLIKYCRVKKLVFLNSVPDMIIIIIIIIIVGGGMINSVPDIIRDTAEATRGGHLDSRGCWLRLNIVTPTTAEIFINIKI